MKRLFTALLLVTILLPRLAHAQTAQTCPVPRDASWTKTEAWVWSQICTGRVADLTKQYPAAQYPPADRTISAAFIRI